MSTVVVAVVIIAAFLVGVLCVALALAWHEARFWRRHYRELIDERNAENGWPKP